MRRNRDFDYELSDYGAQISISTFPILKNRREDQKTYGSPFMFFPKNFGNIF
jgi:hypothetical protein